MPQLMCVVAAGPVGLDHAPLHADADPARARALDLGAGAILVAVGEAPVEVDDEPRFRGVRGRDGRERGEEHGEREEAATHTLVVGTVAAA